MRSFGIKRSLAQKQRGMTFAGWAFTIGAVCFIALIVMKLVPCYIEYYQVKGIVDRLSQVPLITKKTPNRIRILIQRRLNLENVNTLNTRNKDDVKISNRGGVLKIDIEWDVTTPLIGNLDAVAHFKVGTKIIAQ